MFRNKSHRFVCLIIFVISLLSYHSQASTSAEVVKRAATKASAAKNEVLRRKVKIERLEKKLVDSKEQLSKAERGLQLRQTETPNAESIIIAAEQEVNSSRSKFDELTRELDDEKTSLEISQGKAAHYMGLENKLRSRRHLELTRYKFERRKKQLMQYSDKVRELEIKERKRQAEVIARMRLAGRARGQWERRSAEFKVQYTKRRAEYLLHKLKTFRDKFAEATEDVGILASEMQEATADYSQYGKE